MGSLFKSKEGTTRSLFWNKILNNKFVLFLLIVLIILINLLIFTKIAYLFEPLIQVVNLFLFPAVTSVILYYLFIPVVNQFEKMGIKKHWTVLMIFVFIFLILSVTIGSIYPIIRNQVVAFAENVPAYFATIQKMLDELPGAENPSIQNLGDSLQNFMNGFSLESLTQQINPIVTSTFGGIGNIVGQVTVMVTGLITIPIFTYYLLVSSDKIPPAILRFVPKRHQVTISRMMEQGNYQVSQYIRGQILVAICVGIMFAIGYGMIGLEYGTTLAVTAGFLNIIPYLGSFIAVIPALIIALITSPAMLLKVIIVMMIEQTIEGRFISPQILGNSLQIHPVTILIVLLSAGQLFGVPGVIMGVPLYAVLKVIVEEIVRAYQDSQEGNQEEMLEEELVSTVNAAESEREIHDEA